jgi:hypothetical protein
MKIVYVLFPFLLTNLYFYVNSCLFTIHLHAIDYSMTNILLSAQAGSLMTLSFWVDDAFIQNFELSIEPIYLSLKGINSIVSLENYPEASLMWVVKNY